MCSFCVLSDCTGAWETLFDLIGGCTFVGQVVVRRLEKCLALLLFSMYLLFMLGELVRVDYFLGYMVP